MTDLVSCDIIENRIFIIRGQKVMVDRDLAELYGVETKYLNRQVRSNISRFPEEFMFQLVENEKNELVQICHRFKTMKHSLSMPYVFTEHGVTMLASVLNSDRAIKISIGIVKIFVRLRNIAYHQEELASKLNDLECKIEKHDTEIHAIFDAIKQLMEPPPEKEKPRIGFRP